MTVAGQPQITYGYDDANRLTQIAQGASTVGFSYDDANRRATLTLSNGVNVTYTYDNDSRVKNLTYKFNTGVLGDLTYTYDELGRRTLVGGSFARTGLPGAITSATYDAANELTNWNGTTINYDLNGNMLSDGTNAFTWNARNQVATLNNVSLQYDAFGRRTQNLLGTSFLYDGANAAQELSGTTATANMLTGGIDEFFNRTDSSGSFTPLQDALGSTIALVDGSGNIATSYTYEPFGNTTLSGALSSNPSQYTGRENEGNGLYYYRTRYYSPLLGRFVSEDPLGFAGSGPNVYAYANNTPTNLVDPFGLESGNLNNLVPGPNGETALSGRKDDPYPKRLFGTHWCGKGGAGPPLTALDEGCMVHDNCFDAIGVSADANTGPGTVTLDQAAAMQKCNEALYAVSVAHPEDPGSSRIKWWLEYGDEITLTKVLAPGTGVRPYIPEPTAQQRAMEQYYQNHIGAWLANPRSF